ncbi:hypothetical protein PGT21_036624 [Puccinia graminis f. sp. tritici]|uniref:Uncharacterized protein n=1 Tax=Puccinia graminis f. sp. tritici TaxID=56615 RepID=A0A5B0P9X4_PUCGR|nr:hypothetical protein PGT21_036624 [Puccinia graminis f. sp. tritici]KAA1097098.1 hypothetical protein PGTUg99_005686 [Puccinia graminis f. sp. tritici]
MPTPSKILCPETQFDEESVIERPPRQAPIHLDFSLYVKHLNKADFPHVRVVAAADSWSIISPIRELGAMSIDMQSMTWNRFKALAIDHLGMHHPALGRVLNAAKDSGALHWLPFISGHEKFVGNERIEIRGHLDFLAFATEAYDLFPNKTPALANRLLTPLQTTDSAKPKPVDGVKEARASKAGRSKPKKRLALDDGDAARSLLKAPKRSTTMPGGTSAHQKITPEHDPFEIEVIQQPFPIRPLRNRTYQSHTPFRPPLGPASPQLEAVDMETYLTVAHIHASDEATRRRLNDHGIVHWTFFRRTTEEELLGLGFPLGIARLLCEGVPRLEHFVEQRSLPL